MQRTVQLAAFLLLGLGFVTQCEFVNAEPATGWRADGSGAFPKTTPPTQWSTEKNVLWKVALPGPSFAAPIAVGNQVYVVSDTGDLLCLSRQDGKVMWKDSIKDIKAPEGGGGKFGGKFGGKGKFGGGGSAGSRKSAGLSAATPVSDGKLVAAVFGNGIVAVYTPEGKRLWAKHVEPTRVFFGHAAAPLLLEGKLIVHLNDMVALEIATGKELWRKTLPASHASPVGIRLGKEDFVVSPAGAFIQASDGAILAKDKFRVTEGSPVISGNIVYVSNQKGSEAFELSSKGTGDLTVKSLWKVGEGAISRGAGGFSEERGDRRYPSPLIHEGLLYNVSTSGSLEVLDLKTGKQAYRQARLGVSNVYSSVTLAGNLIYVFDTRGRGVVFKPGPKFELVATNELEPTGSNPFFVDDQLFVRCDANLYCLSSKAGK